MLAIEWLSRHHTLSAAIILILALHVCFFPFIWGHHTLLAGSRGVPSVMPAGAFYGGPQGPAIYRGNDMGAAAWVIEADAPLVRYQYLTEKHLPLWNPYQAYGAPLAANMQSQPFNPLYLLFAMHPGPRTFNLFILCRFFVAGICAYLYLRLFLPFTASLAGSLVCMLSGYYILFFNMPHLSVDVLIPALFLTVERMLRQQSTRHVLLAVLVIFLSIAGGMPESTLLALTFVSAYFLFRLLGDHSLRSAARRHVLCFASVNLLGFALAAFLLAPFVEFLRYSFDVHQVKNIGHLAGIAHDRFGLSIFTYVIPTLFGTAWHTIAPGLGGYTALRGFFGILAIWLAMVAVAGLLTKTHRRPAVFFLAAVIVLLLKRYGSPLINWIGYLPLFRLVQYQKYEEPVLAFALSVLCAFGVHQVLAQTISRRRLLESLLAAFLLLTAIVALSLPAVLAAHAELRTYYAGLSGAAVLLFLAAVLVFGTYAHSSARGRNWVAAGLLALLLCELAGNYIYPVYYLLTRSATDQSNPYQGAPYISFLKSKLTANERIFGRDGILHPAWAGSFQLDDIRGLDAMYHWKYLRFVRYFLRDEVPGTRGGDLVERFTGSNEHTFDTSLKRRLLQLSSVKYLLSVRPFPPDAPLVRDILDQNQGHLAPGREHLIETRQFVIGGAPKTVLYQHPPYERLPFTTSITPGKQRFFFSIALDPAVYDGSQPICGDGVEFRLEARERNGHTALLYTRYIDPKHNLSERRWIDESVDLSHYLGQNIALLFTTTPGPAGDTCADWAGWGDPHFPAARTTQPPFSLVYDHEIKIYEYADHLPRAALFSSVEFAADDDAALSRLASPSLNIFQAAVVSQNGLDVADAAALRSLNRNPPVPVRAARIVSYNSQEVTIHADTQQPALLVLHDTDYPGWKVSIDGRPSHRITANYLFRGVWLPAGKHIVRFSYAPLSFALGAAISGAGLLSLAGFVAWRRRKTELRVAEPHLVH